MATKIMAEVWEHSPAKGSELLFPSPLPTTQTVSTRSAGLLSSVSCMIRMSERNTQYLLLAARQMATCCPFS